MHILTRTLGTLMLAIALGVLLAGTASAASVRIQTSIQGVGGAYDPITGWQCDQRPPASQREIMDCSTPMDADASSGGAYSVELRKLQWFAGWTFERWTGCDRVSGSSCYVDVPVSGPDRTVYPRAIFKDTAAPGVLSLRVVSSDTEGRYRATWGTNEPGVRYTCAIDNGAAVNCEPGHSFTLPAGTHRLTVTPEDPSGNVGSQAEAELSVVETVLDEAPDDGAHAAASRFVAHTVPGTAIECSLDGGAWFACGGASGALTLPALADGEHTLRARGVLNGWVDQFPATRTWTVDTTAPDTSLIGFRLEASEPVSGFRCRVDGADVPCATILPSTPGTHTFQAAAVDRAGNVDPTPATRRWTVETPTAQIQTQIQTVLAPTRIEVPAAAKPVALDVFYSYSRGRLTRLVVTGPVGYKLTVKRPGRRARATTARKLVGKRLPKRTRITARAGAATRTIKLR